MDISHICFLWYNIYVKSKNNCRSIVNTISNAYKDHVEHGHPIITSIELKDIPVSTALAGAVIQSTTQDALTAKVYPISGLSNKLMRFFPGIPFDPPRAGTKINIFMILGYNYLNQAT